VGSRGGETVWGDKEERLRCLGGDDEERRSGGDGETIRF